MIILLEDDWTDLRDLNERTSTYEGRPNLRDVNKASECLALFLGSITIYQQLGIIPGTGTPITAGKDTKIQDFGNE